MEIKTYHILYLIGLFVVLGGVIYLSQEFLDYISDKGRLAILALLTVTFMALSRYAKEKGW